MKILCSGDLHVGRGPSRLPDAIDAKALSCGECWGSLVDLALSEKVDLLALSGDIVDQANKYYEATGPLERGLRRLAEAAIQVVAVAGNHDHDVLPRLIADLDSDNVKFLGAGGRWERHTIVKEGVPVLHVDGWSFPSAIYRDDPLRGYASGDGDGVPVLGLLHADLDQPGSPYAPVRLPDLQRLPPSFWLLGHVHVPGLYGNRVLYPGSPQAMDPGESGPHGPWLLELHGHGRHEIRQLPLSLVRYEVIEVDVTGATDELHVDSAVRNAVVSKLREIEIEGCGPLKYLSCRILLVGRTALHRKLLSRTDRIGSGSSIPGGSTASALIERISVATRPPVDLNDLARVADAPGTIARLLLALESGELDAEQEKLVRQAERRAREVANSKAFSALSDSGGSSDSLVASGEIIDILKDQSYLLLDELLASKERV
ncbi:MAG TPA: DNA repair exonuclease [Longimicrobiaceae bacterium]|nr:DNA repair exonuclease [Longimicrobiaceae bacterium]